MSQTSHVRNPGSVQELLRLYRAGLIQRAEARRLLGLDGARRAAVPLTSHPVQAREEHAAPQREAVPVAVAAAPLRAEPPAGTWPEQAQAQAQGAPSPPADGPAHDPAYPWRRHRRREPRLPDLIARGFDIVREQHLPHRLIWGAAWRCSVLAFGLTAPVKGMTAVMVSLVAAGLLVPGAMRRTWSGVGLLPTCWRLGAASGILYWSFVLPLPAIAALAVVAMAGAVADTLFTIAGSVVVLNRDLVSYRGPGS